MYKLVIVEDEDNIRHSLESFIPWEKMGFQVVGAFGDGEDALAYLKDNPCDALLTDILMRRMSGLELIQHLSGIHPEIKVVILSGHSEFTYAQQAITYRVVQYLVKPVDEDELMDVFSGIKDQLDSELTHRATHSVSHTTDLPETDNEPVSQEQQLEKIAADYRLLMLELDRGSKQTLVRLLEQLMLPLRSAPLEDVRLTFKNLYAVIELNYKKRKISTWDITNGRFNFNHLYKANSLNAIGECVKEDFCVLCDSLKKRTYRSEHTAIAQIVQYLEEHIDEDISHDAMANKYRIHPGYLSRLFKQEMGETVSEYLLRRRMEKAATLLTEGKYKVGEVAAMVGYSTSSYFSINFKKYTGYSPKEYSQRVLL